MNKFTVLQALVQMQEYFVKDRKNTEVSSSLQKDFSPWVGKIPWRRERLPAPVFWPGEFHGPYRLWGRQKSDTTEWLFTSLDNTIQVRLRGSQRNFRQIHFIIIRELSFIKQPGCCQLLTRLYHPETYLQYDVFIIQLLLLAFPGILL